MLKKKYSDSRKRWVFFNPPLTLTLFFLHLFLLQCRKKVNAVSRVERMHETLQKAHADLQKRDEHHKRERAQLQKELAQLQLQKSRVFT